MKSTIENDTLVLALEGRIDKRRRCRKGLCGGKYVESLF